MSGIRYRRDIDCLTSDQLHDFREAVAAMFELPPEDENSFEKIGGLHGSDCIHGYPGFLTWHRAYMEVFEKALQCCCDNPISLPFWDWSSGPSTGIPSACATSTYVNRDGDTVPNPLYAGPLPPSQGGGMTARHSEVDTRSFDTMATAAQNALTQSSFSSFQSMLNGPHGGVHINVGGNMASFAGAGFDPIFYLHHGNVDRLGALWQNTHPGTLPANEASLELEPFNKPYSADWKTGADFATTDQLGYRYSRFCFFFPDIDMWKIMMARIDPKWFTQRVRSAKLVLKSDRMPVRSMEIRVFINEPEPSVKTPTLGNPRFAGSLGMFGMTAGDEAPMEMKRRPNQRFDLELDISRTLAEQGKSGEEVSMKLVPVSVDGRAVSPDKANLEGIDLLLD